MLRWPGGKKRAAKFLMKYAPHDFAEFRDCFVGGNGLLLTLPKDVRVWVNDLSPWVAEFWRWMRDCKTCVEQIMRRKELCLSLSEYTEAARQYFADCKVRLEQFASITFVSARPEVVSAFL